MFTLILPVADYLPLILKNLDLPEVTYRETKDSASKPNLCTASVYFAKNHAQLRLFSTSSPDGALSAKHLAAAAAIHHLKQAYQFVVVDMNHRELAELKGITSDPSPFHVTQVSPSLDDVFDPDTFVDFCFAEKITFCSVGEHSAPNQNLAAATSLIIECGHTNSPPVATTRTSVYIANPEVQTAKNVKPDTHSAKKSPPTVNAKSGEVDCYQELKALKNQFELLQLENSKLQTDVLENNLKAIHYQQGKARVMRISRTFARAFENIEATDEAYNQRTSIRQRW